MSIENEINSDTDNLNQNDSELRQTIIDKYALFKQSELAAPQMIKMFSTIEE